MRSVAVLLSLAACEGVDAAPTDLDGVLHAFWDGYEADDDAAVVSNALILEQITDEEALLGDAIDGSQARFTQEDLEVVDLHAPPDDDGTWTLPDATKARPIFLLNRFTCDMDQLERILIEQDQQALFGDYDSYQRDYTSSDADFRAGTAQTLTWTAVLQASYPLAGKYEETLNGGVRRVKIEGTSPFSGETLLLARTWLPFPARSIEGSIDFRQDYQLEVYLPWGDGDIIHLYGIRRELGLGPVLGSMESDGIARLTLDNLESFDDDKVQGLCEQGRPPAP